MMTPIGNKINVWNALTGELKLFYSENTSHEITAFNIDELKKRIIYGDVKGQVFLLNLMNGAKINSLPSHNCEVCYVMHILKLKSFISCSIDG